MLSPRSMTKFTLRTATHAVVANTSTTAMTEVVDPQSQTTETVIGAGGHLIAFVVVQRVGPYTDRMVDAVADWRINRKNANASE